MLAKRRHPRNATHLTWTGRLVAGVPRCHTGRMATPWWRVACLSATSVLVTSLLGVAPASPALMPAPSPSPSAAPATIDRAPLRTIRGTSTQLWTPNQVGVSPDGSLVVANEGNASLSTYPAGASGNVSPTRRLVGGATGISALGGVHVDGDGTTYVSDFVRDRISVFAPGASGNAAPVRTISGARTRLDAPVGLDVRGDQLVVANRDGNSVLVFAKSAQGNAAPVRAITGAATQLSQPFRVAVGDGGELVVGTLGSRITTYAAGATGNAKPIRTLTGSLSTFGRVTGLDLDAQGNLYVASQDATAPVVVFAPRASGSARPTVKLEGLLHDLALPLGLTVLANRHVVVSDLTTDAVHTFAPLVTPARVVRRPGRVRNLKVSGGPRANRRAVTWRWPASNGGAKVTRHRVVVKKGKRVVAVRTPKARRVVLRRGQLPQGRLVVTVQARNKKGLGPATRRVFVVRK